MDIKACVTGKVEDIAKVEDGVFSDKLLGDGFIIQATDKTIVAPFDGELVTAFDTGHAYGIKGADGTAVLIHIGVDTVELEGKPFKKFVEQGTQVKAGDKLCEVDFEAIKASGRKEDVIVIVLTESETKLENVTYGDTEVNTIIATTK